MLLFTIEPLAAKALLPVLGGSPAVWNTAMAFFQIALLGGYLTAHIDRDMMPAPWRRSVQLSLLVLPLVNPSIRSARPNRSDEFTRVVGAGSAGLDGGGTVFRPGGPQPDGAILVRGDRSPAGP